MERVTYASEASAFRVIKVAVEGRPALVTVVGSYPPVAAGARVRVRGTLEMDPRHGEQVRAASVTEVAPSTLQGIERYLGSGMIKGIGEAYAKRIVAAFGLDTLKVLDETPERLREVEGLGRRRVEAVVEAWKEQRTVREVMVFLQAHGASPGLAVRVFKRYGAKAVAVVSRDPFRLALDVWGVGFRTADRIAAALGIGKDSPVRIQAGLLQVLHDAGEQGHVYVPAPELFLHGARLLDLDSGDGDLPSDVEAKLTSALGALASSRHVAVEGQGPTRVFSSALHEAEVRLSTRLRQLLASAPAPLPGADAAVTAFEAGAGVHLAPEQREAVATAARARVLVITGGPGVGKTTIVRAIVAMFRGAGLEVRLAAPTGRAAKRMTEATGQEAATLHRLLEFEPKKGTFRRGRAAPVEAQALVVDEASMIDLPMADALSAAVADDARLVLVGDVDQLPSVGPGAVLRDLIGSGVIPCVRLTRIFRQARQSLIVENAHRINMGERPLLPEAGDTSGDFFLVERRDPEAARATVVELLKTRIPRRFGLDPVDDVQVLAPMHRGAAGTAALNEALQEALNPGSPGLTRGGRTLRVGDKVMQLRNDYDRNVWNGDVGKVLRVDPEEERLVVGFDPRRAATRRSEDAPTPTHPHGKEEVPAASFEREVAYDASTLDELTLAYACSVHKSQGSEYPAVVIPLLTAHFVMLNKNLLYTAVTRGKRLVVLVADPRAVDLALGQVRNDERRTALAERLASA